MRTLYFCGSKLYNGYVSSLINVCEEYNNFQDTGKMFMISDFKVLPKILFKQLNFNVFPI